MPDLAVSPQCYQAFGLNLSSFFPLPELSRASSDTPDLEILDGDVPETLPDAQEVGVRYEATSGRLLLRVDGIARYLVEDGSRITVRPERNASEDDVRLFLLGSALGAALQQRGDLVLHASAIVAGDDAVGFMGFSGIGKSTLAMEFRRRGYRLLTDDLCVVRPGATGELLAVPGFPQCKLWHDSLRQLDIPAEGLRRIRSKLEKCVLPLGEQFATEAYPLRHLYVLLTQPTDEITLRPFSGPAKFAAVKNHTYRFRFVDGMGQRIGHFEAGAALARRVAITQVWRPRHHFRLTELADRLEADLAR